MFILSLTANFHEAGPLPRYSLYVVVQYFKCHNKDTENKRKMIFLSDYTAAFIFLRKRKQGENTCNTSWYCFPLFFVSFLS